jgi:3-hydroxymyristoyl/3-hydroxydecanoyl-(acyl carrier protein) dehydratase
MEAELVNRKNKVVLIATKAYVDNKLVAEAELMAAVVDKETNTNDANKK